MASAMRLAFFWLLVVTFLIHSTTLSTGSDITETPVSSSTPSRTSSISNDYALSQTNGSFSPLRTPKTLHAVHALLHKHRRNEFQHSNHCGPGRPCLDGSCCNTNGECGFKPAHCGMSCISNCGATAMCGVDSPPWRHNCSLNLCCSFNGWCGV